MRCRAREDKHFGIASAKHRYYPRIRRVPRCNGASPAVAVTTVGILIRDNDVIKGLSRDETGRSVALTVHTHILFYVRSHVLARETRFVPRAARPTLVPIRSRDRRSHANALLNLCSKSEIYIARSQAERDEVPSPPPFACSRLLLYDRANAAFRAGSIFTRCVTYLRIAW